MWWTWNRSWDVVGNLIIIFFLSFFSFFFGLWFMILVFNSWLFIFLQVGAKALADLMSRFILVFQVPSVSYDFVGMTCKVEVSYNLSALPISVADWCALLPYSGVGLGLPLVFWGSWTHDFIMDGRGLWSCCIGWRCIMFLSGIVSWSAIPYSELCGVSSL